MVCIYSQCMYVQIQYTGPERWDKRESKKISVLYIHNITKHYTTMGNLDDTCNTREKKCLLLAKKELLYTPCMELSAT